MAQSENNRRYFNSEAGKNRDQWTHSDGDRTIRVRNIRNSNPYATGKFDDVVKQQSNGWKNASGDVRYRTTINSPSYYVSPIIVRGDGIAGTRLVVGSEITGTKTNDKVSVINRDGSDYAAYYFVITTNGKWVNYVDLQDLGGGKYKVASAGYPYTPEYWIDTNRNGTIIPSGYSLSGTEENIKVSTGGLSSYETKKFIKTVIDGETVYVPFENVAQSIRKVGAAIPVEITPPLNTGTENTDPKIDVGDGNASQASMTGNIVGIILVVGVLFGMFKIMK